ncbi:carbonic anhydrase [Natrialbaceae archaeon A-gly3]
MGNYDLLPELLEGNHNHLEGLPEGYFDDVQEEQHPNLVSICCSDSRIPQVEMWNIDEPGQVFTPSNIGNRVWDEDGDERIVDSGVLYPIHYTGTGTVAIVGHTGCGAVTAAYRVATGGDRPGPRGVGKHVQTLVPVIEEALESDEVDADADERTVVNQLVEYNVDYQARFLHESDDIPDDVTVYGFVYDFQGVYSAEKGRAYLVNLDGETGPEAIAAEIPEEYEAAVSSLLY